MSRQIAQAVRGESFHEAPRATRKRQFPKREGSAHWVLGYDVKKQGDEMSTTFFVSRHPGALQWATQCGLRFDAVIPHLDITCVQAGDTVIGTLPLELAAKVQAMGARYRHLSLSLPADQRGRELSAADLFDLGARVLDFDIRLIINPTQGFMTP